MEHKQKVSITQKSAETPSTQTEDAAFEIDSGMNNAIPLFSTFSNNPPDSNILNNTLKHQSSEERYRSVIQLQRIIGNRATIKLLNHNNNHNNKQDFTSPLIQRQPRRGGRGASPSFSRASNPQQYVALVREAERRLAAAGHSTIEDRLHIFTSIYYGSDWSLDYEVEQSQARNAAFQLYTARPFSASDDPRTVLGQSLFRALRRSQDVAGVDMGHMMIGLDARMRTLSRAVNIPLHGATGVEITTWVGDLAGASARLALDRLRKPNTPVRHYFRGTDYGASSNLEGDIAAYVAADNTGSNSVEAAVMPTNSIADAIQAYFTPRVQANRYRRFLELQGGVFSGNVLSNRSAVEAGMAAKLTDFGRLYMANWIRGHGSYSTLEVAQAQLNLSSVANEVAQYFVTWLLDRMAQQRNP
jgi:hypothetical protein